MLTAVIDSVCREHGVRVLAGLIRRFGDFDLAEDALQDAFAKALEVWPAEGLPTVPAAWLTTVAQRRAPICCAGWAGLARPAKLMRQRWVWCVTRRSVATWSAG